jgi:hypothetical protein
MAINKTEQIYQQHIKTLPPSERLALIEIIARDLIAQKDQISEKPKHDIMELHGLGKETWIGVDVQESFDLKEFINDWSSEEIEIIEQIYNDRQSFFDGRRFDL